jgi:hypothetical protein
MTWQQQKLLLQPLCTYSWQHAVWWQHADGYTEIVGFVATVCPKGDVIINHDPNHYTKGLSKHVTNLW